MKGSGGGTGATRLDVPVDYAVVVQEVQDGQHRVDDGVDAPALVQPAACPALESEQVAYGAMLEHQVNRLVVLEGCEQVQDVAMREPRMDGDLAADLGVLDLVDAGLEVLLEGNLRRNVALFGLPGPHNCRMGRLP